MSNQKDINEIYQELSYDELTELLQKADVTPSDDEDDGDVEEAVSTSKVSDTPVSNTTDHFDEPIQ